MQIKTILIPSLFLLTTTAVPALAGGNCWHKSTVSGRYIKCTLVPRTWTEWDGLSCEAYEYIVHTHPAPDYTENMCPGEKRPQAYVPPWEQGKSGVLKPGEEECDDCGEGE